MDDALLNTLMSRGYEPNADSIINPTHAKAADGHVVADPDIVEGSPTDITALNNGVRSIANQTQMVTDLLMRNMGIRNTDPLHPQLLSKIWSEALRIVQSKPAEISAEEWFRSLEKLQTVKVENKAPTSENWARIRNVVNEAREKLMQTRISVTGFDPEVARAGLPELVRKVEGLHQEAQAHKQQAEALAGKIGDLTGLVQNIENPNSVPEVQEANTEIDKLTALQQVHAQKAAEAENMENVYQNMIDSVNRSLESLQSRRASEQASEPSSTMEIQSPESIRAQARENDRRAQELEEHINRAVAQGEHGEARDLRTEQKRLSKEAARLDRMADQMTAAERAANPVHELSSGEGIKMPAVTPAEVSRAEAPEKPTLLLAAPKPMLMLEAPRETQTLELHN